MADDTDERADLVARQQGHSGGGGDGDVGPQPPLLLSSRSAEGDISPSGIEGNVAARDSLPTPSSNGYDTRPSPLRYAPAGADTILPASQADEGEDLPAGPALVEGYALAGGSVHPWEQIEGEGAKAYAAFCCYRDMGYERSTSAVARTMGKHVALMQRWSTLYSWVDRTRRYQLYLDRQRRGRAEDQRLGMLDRHRGTAERVVELVDLWVESKLAQARKAGPDARVDIPDSQIAALLRVAAVVERQSLGLPADQTASVSVNEHRHTHTLELPGGPGQGGEAGTGASPVKDWVAKLRERADELGIGQAATPLALRVGQDPAADPHAQAQTDVEADGYVVDAVARELGVEDGIGSGRDGDRDPDEGEG